jgi:hypothetical protein
VHSLQFIFTINFSCRLENELVRAVICNCDNLLLALSYHMLTATATTVSRSFINIDNYSMLSLDDRLVLRAHDNE